MKSKKKKVLQGALSTILVMYFIVMLLSFILSLIGFGSHQTYIANGYLESSLVMVNNIFSGAGFKYLFTSSVTNFKMFEPLALLIISLIGVSIADESGMLDVLFLPLRKIKSSFLSFIVILLGISVTFFGSYSYVMLFPLVAILYKKIGKSPILGLITVFLGITLGYGTGIMFNYDSYVLGSLTQASATVDVDSEYVFSLVSTEYIKVISTFIISIVLSGLVEKRVAPNFSKRDPMLSNNKFSYPTLFLAIFLIMIVIYMIIPGLPFSGMLLDNNAVRYIDKLFDSSSPFANSFICIFMFILAICGLFYGFLNGKKTSDYYAKGISKTFDGLGYLFVLMFFISQLSSLIDWTNIGVVFGSRMIDFLGNSQLSGLFLILIFFIVIVVMSILIPSASAKWIISSPIVVPLFMRSNITPDFTQFVFQVADSVGKGMTPIFSYFIIMIGFMEKYISDDDKSVTIVGTFKLTFPIVAMMGLLWMVIISLWFLSGFPIGINGYSTL